jgi:hypothetical protein
MYIILWYIKIIKRIKEFIKTFKEERGCNLCGEMYISCLEFHHQDQFEKEIDISLAVKQ